MNPSRLAVQMMPRFLLLSLFFSMLISGCSTIAHQPTTPSKYYSTAFDHPEYTQLGKRAMQLASAHPTLSGFCVLNTGLDGFDVRLQLIDKAEISLDLQYYIFRQDDTGMLISQHLLQAADRGVRVRILVDDGDTEEGDERLLSLAAHPNIQVRIFNPLRYRGHARFLRFAEILLHKSDLDYRMHNKLFLVDASVGLLGGRNIGDQYFQIEPQSQFGDDDVFTIGPLVADLNKSFDAYWNASIAIPAQDVSSVYTAPDTLEHYSLQLLDHETQLQQSSLAFLDRMHRNKMVNSLFSEQPPLTWAEAQLVYDDPDKKAIEDGYYTGRQIAIPVKEALNQATQDVHIITPFFVPGEDGMTLLNNLRNRDIAVSVLTNSLESTPELAAHAGYAHYREPLLQSGVKLFELRADPEHAKGSGQSRRLLDYGHYGLHAKQYIIDGKRIFIGSMNFDQRSLHINTEIGLIINSPALAHEALRRFDALSDPANSYEVRLNQPNPDSPGQLVWETSEQGNHITYTTEPAKSAKERLIWKFLSLLPLDDEL